MSIILRVIILCCAWLCASVAAAQPFYAGRIIQLIVGFGTGGGYDQIGRAHV